MKVALVHDYLTQRGGAERVFELICKQFPDADIYTSIYDSDHSIQFKDRVVNTTQLQSIPGAARYFRLLAPLYYSAFRSLDLQEYDLIISSSSSFAKAVQKRPDAKHICFCHNVTRFLWDTKVYLQGYREYQQIYPLISPIFAYMKRLDLEYAGAPDLYIANSSTVANRIKRIYRKPVVMINYPINDRKFVYSDQKDDFFLVSSRLLSYKRIDIVVEAFNWLGWPLIIMGDGPERKSLEAKSLPNIQFLGHISDRERAHLMSKARFVITAALEDYGLVPVEANFSGTPTITYGAGGVLDTQVPGLTGVFFNRQSPDALQKAVLQASEMDWNSYQIHNYAMQNFTEEVFFDRVDRLITQVCANHVPVPVA